MELKNRLHSSNIKSIKTNLWNNYLSRTGNANCSDTRVLQLAKRIFRRAIQVKKKAELDRQRKGL